MRVQSSWFGVWRFRFRAKGDDLLGPRHVRPPRLFSLAFSLSLTPPPHSPPPPPPHRSPCQTACPWQADARRPLPSRVPRGRQMRLTFGGGVKVDRRRARPAARARPAPRRAHTSHGSPPRPPTGFGLWDSEFESRVSGFGFRLSGFGTGLHLRVSGFGLLHYLVVRNANGQIVVRNARGQIQRPAAPRRHEGVVVALHAALGLRPCELLGES